MERFLTITEVKTHGLIYSLYRVSNSGYSNGILTPFLLQFIQDLVKKMLYQPAVDRARPAVLELVLVLPARSMVKFSVSFDKVFLKYTEHPPDANRGFDVGCAVITALLPRERGQIGYGSLDHLRIYQEREASLVQNSRPEAVGETMENEQDKIRVYTETLLVSLPTPDFSMPYNVITLTCTVIALFFGSMFNLMTRNFEVVEQTKLKGDKGKGKREDATTK